MRTYFLLGLLFISTTCIAQLQIFFDPGKSVVHDTSRKRLLQWAEEIKSTETVNLFTLNGHTDNTGDNKTNRELGLKRSLAVKKILIEAGFEDKYIKLESFGEVEPSGDNNTEEGRQLNRRVDVFVFTHPMIQEQKDELEKKDASDIGELYEKLKDKGQLFCVNPARDTALVGKNGTIVYYKANTLSPGSCSCINIVLHEYYTKSDLVLNNLTTTSNDRPLESGGMIKLEAYCNNQLLELKNNNFLTVMVPTDTLLPDMKLFSANREKQTDILNWNLDPSALDTADWNRWLLACAYRRESADSLKNCTFFFCRIKRLFQPNNKKRLERYNDLINKERGDINRYQMKEEQLESALKKSKEMNAGVLKYYVYKNFNWDYRNIDRYSKPIAMTNYIVEAPVKEGFDVKLVYKISKTVVPGKARSDNYMFPDVWKGIDVWIIGLGFKNGVVSLALKATNTNDQRPKLEFREMSIEELKEALTVINK